MTLEALLDEIEQNVGIFSSYHVVINDNVVHGQSISFAKKPAQQFLAALGGVNLADSYLSYRQGNAPIPLQGNSAIALLQSASFDPSQEGALLIESERVDRLVNSAKIYVNTEVFPEGLYSQVLANKTVRESGAAEKQIEKGWKQIAVGVCHVQEVDFLVAHQMTADGRAVATMRTGEIKKDDPAVLLLSSPALNFGYGKNRADMLETADVPRFIKAMYRNLFSAALAEGRKYIAMPAAGLGVFRGKPEQYFPILMEVAQEYPQLNIIYNPSPKFATQFDAALAQSPVTNVVRATKDVMFIASALAAAGYSCAFHNPSDCDILYGIYDPGEYWKNGTGDRYVGEEHLGAMTTAPLNGIGFNPNAYATVVERNLSPDAPAATHSFIFKSSKSKYPEPIILPVGSQDVTVATWFAEKISAKQKIGGRHGSQDEAYLLIMRDLLQEAGVVEYILPIDPTNIEELDTYVNNEVMLIRQKYGFNHGRARQECQVQQRDKTWQDFFVKRCLPPSAADEKTQDTEHVLVGCRKRYEAIRQIRLKKSSTIGALSALISEALGDDPTVSIKHYIEQAIKASGGEDAASLPKQHTYQQVKPLLEAINSAYQTLDKDEAHQIKETERNRFLLEEVGLALYHVTGVLMIPGAENIPAEWNQVKYNENLDSLAKLAQSLTGHGSTELQVLGGLLFSLGVAAVIAFVLLPAVPAFAGVFTAVLHNAGLYTAAAAVGGQLGAAAGAGIVGAVAGAVTAAGGATLFARNRQQGMSKLAADIAQTEQLKDPKSKGM